MSRRDLVAASKARIQAMMKAVDDAWPPEDKELEDEVDAILEEARSTAAGRQRKREREFEKNAARREQSEVLRENEAAAQEAEHKRRRIDADHDQSELYEASVINAPGASRVATMRSGARDVEAQASASDLAEVQHHREQVSALDDSYSRVSAGPRPDLYALPGVSGTDGGERVFLAPPFTSTRKQASRQSSEESIVSLGFGTSGKQSRGLTRASSLAGSVSEIGLPDQQLKASNRDYPIAMKFNAEWHQQPRAEGLGAILLQELLKYISDSSAKIERWEKMLPLSQVCILSRVVSKQAKGSFKNAYEAIEACKRCVGRDAGSGRKSERRPCAALTQIRGETTIAFLPLPASLRVGKSPTDIAYWIVQD